jgi:uncharacterized Zn finger protein
MDTVDCSCPSCGFADDHEIVGESDGGMLVVECSWCDRQFTVTDPS